jgi:hypothetical protein
MGVMNKLVSYLRFLLVRSRISAFTVSFAVVHIASMLVYGSKVLIQVKTPSASASNDDIWLHRKQKWILHPNISLQHIAWEQGCVISSVSVPSPIVVHSVLIGFTK